MKAAFGLQLEEAGDVGFGKLRDIDMGGKDPFERQRNNAKALANLGGIEVIPDFEPDEFGSIGKRVQ